MGFGCSGRLCGIASTPSTSGQRRAVITGWKSNWGRVFLFLHTDDFWRDFHLFKERGVVFVREPKEESYGTVAVFQDLYGNLWDLLQLN
jgi:hypothetical protein